MRLIQAQIRQDCVGRKHVKSPWERLLPLLGNPNKQEKDIKYFLMPSGSLLSEKYRGKKLSFQKWSEKGVFSHHQIKGLRRILTRNIGLGVRVSEVILSRGPLHFKRIEEFVSGFVDSLWCADEQVFLFGSSQYNLIKKLVRKIFCVGSTNLCSLTDQWKEWGNYLFHSLAETETIGTLIKPSRLNIFNRLNQLDVPMKVFKGEKSMLLMQHVAHLSSSRQMPYMGKAREDKSQQAFIEVLNCDFQPEPQTIIEMKRAAYRIGRICRSIRPRDDINRGVSHVSVTAAGEYDHPVSKGANASAVKDALMRVLTRIPDEDTKEDTPFGLVWHRKGIPIWKTLFRKEPLSIDAEFLDPYATVKEQPGRFHGLDEVTGKQLLYVAWKESYSIPIVRAEVVPEMGDKARFVTVSEYWLNLLQMPLGHVLIDALKWHPSVFSSFHRQDQAFEAAKGLARMKLPLLKGEALLSSDLKDATNAQHWELTQGILRSFMDGYGLIRRMPYINLILNLIGPRLVEFKDGTFTISKTGIMMGEAIAKPSLTLLNLCIEELAFHRYCGAMQSHFWMDGPAPYRKWRFIHIGGDDHLARGPIPYLREITELHKACGSHIDPGKHGWSRVCVKYTERILNARNIGEGKEINKDYGLSIIVDTVKVRLLERGQSTLIKRDNKNVAIGKASQLGGCLEWLPRDREYYPEGKADSIRALFIERMGSFLPRKAVNPRAFAAIHLPTKVGGFGLGRSEELEYWLYRSPEPTIGLIHKAYAGEPILQDCRPFRTLNTNTSRRGVTKIVDFQRKIVDQLSEWPGMVNAMSWKDLQAKYPVYRYDARRLVARAAEDGILSFEDFAKRATRGNLFQEVLMGKEKLQLFNTHPFVSTYRDIVWKQSESGGLLEWANRSEHLTSQQIKETIGSILPIWFLDIHQQTSMDVGHWDPEDPDSETWDFRDSTFIGKYTSGFPSFHIGFKILGLVPGEKHYRAKQADS